MSFLIRTKRISLAREMNDRLLEELGKDLGPDHTFTQYAETCACTILEERGMHKEAIDYLSPKVERWERSVPADSPQRQNVANAYLYLASANANYGDFQQALMWTRRSLPETERALGPMSFGIVPLQFEAGSFYGKLNEWSQAMSAFNKVLQLVERNNERGNIFPNGSYTLAALDNLGFLHKKLGDLELAKQAYEKALPLAKGTLYADSPSRQELSDRIAEVDALMRQDDTKAATGAVSQPKQFTFRSRRKDLFRQ